jgi:hypothetical protein
LTALPVAALAVNLLVTRTTKTHEIGLVIRSSLSKGKDVVDFLDRDVASFLKTLLTKRVLVDVAVTDSFPSSAVAFAGRVAALELLVVLFHNLGVLLTINAVRQVWASGIAARSLWFSWHKPCLLSGHKESPAG